MYTKTKSGKLVELPSPEEDEKITAAALADPDALPLTDTEWEEAKTRLRPLGRPKAKTTKERITIRLSPEVVEQFRATGSGWQGRMDRALQDYLRNHSQSDIERLG